MLSQPPSNGTARTRPKTLAERAEECTDVQRRLKQEAAERRKETAANGEARPAFGLSQRTGQTGRASMIRRTP
jgi:hypothetical protein